MRSALSSQHLPDHGPVYGDLPDQTTTSAPAYPSFPTSLHHVDSSHDRDLSTYGILSSPAEPPIIPSQHESTDPIDPTFSPNGTPTDRPYQTDTSPLQQHHHDFPALATSPPRPSSSTQHQQPPPAPPISPNTAPPGHFDMLPPPPSTHPSWQALHDYAQSHASAHGYALSINTTAKNRSRIKLACVCYGAPKNTHKLTPETRVRKNRVSYKTGCRMWVEGRRQEDGRWVLRVGEGAHNHEGRRSEGWAVQRKRTWGVKGGRVGVGGVTAKEEMERAKGGEGEKGEAAEEVAQEERGEMAGVRREEHSLESGGLVWKIVEQEMLAGGRPGEGRDRGVGRTVKILEERLPGIHIFKRDVYNIRAQIKRARKAAGQPLYNGAADSDNEDGHDQDGSADTSSKPAQAPPVTASQAHPLTSSQPPGPRAHQRPGSPAKDDISQIDPSLIAQCNSALKNLPAGRESEVERLRREVSELREALARQAKEIQAKNSEIEGLRVQVELAGMALYQERGAGG